MDVIKDLYASNKNLSEQLYKHGTEMTKQLRDLRDQTTQLQKDLVTIAENQRFIISLIQEITANTLKPTATTVASSDLCNIFDNIRTQLKGTIAPN